MPRPRFAGRVIPTIAIVGAALLLLAVIVTLEVRGKPKVEESAGRNDPRIVRVDSHVLQQADAEAPVFVEFLDFECEACAALHPLIEELREKYTGQVTFVTRYFPLPGHPNSRTAAHAAEAAARQGKYEAMYQRLFETQQEWSHSEEDRTDVFRAHAEDLGLDLARFDRDVVSDEVAQRVESDYRDAVSLGLSSTPSLFLDGEQLRPQTVEEFEEAFEDAVTD